MLRAFDSIQNHRGGQLSLLGSAVRDALLCGHGRRENSVAHSGSSEADCGDVHEAAQPESYDTMGCIDNDSAAEECEESEEDEESEECKESEDEIHDSEDGDERASTAMAATSTTPATTTSAVAVLAPCDEHAVHSETVLGTSSAQLALAAASLEAAFLELEEWLLQHADAQYEDFAEVATDKLAAFFRKAGPYRSSTLSWDDYNADFRGVDGGIIWDRACILFRYGTRDPRSCPDEFLRIIARLGAIWTRHFRQRGGAT
jgi:hypothetical protein